KYDDKSQDGADNYPEEGDDGDDLSRDDDDEEDVEEVEEEEEEHPAPTNFVAIVPDEEHIPSIDITTTGARISVRAQLFVTLPPEEEVNRFLALPTPSPSPPITLSPPLAGDRLARLVVPTLTPRSPPLPRSVPTSHREDMPNVVIPP
ncbi:hypothetical protein Tco_1170528, partial [Tanacetum coccineum]